MSYILEFSDTALADIKKHKKTGNKAILKKLQKLLDRIKRTSYNRNRATRNVET